MIIFHGNPWEQQRKRLGGWLSKVVFSAGPLSLLPASSSSAATSPWQSYPVVHGVNHELFLAPTLHL